VGGVLLTVFFFFAGIMEFNRSGILLNLPFFGEKLTVKEIVHDACGPKIMIFARFR
jgi:hypothetical protein